MIYNNLALSITNRCNAKCEMCGINACQSHESENVIEGKKLKKIVNEICENPWIKNIVFTGGEPFLYLNEIKKVQVDLHKNEKKICCVTNGHYFKDIEKREDDLKLFIDCKFDLINISVDEFHLNYIDIQCLRDAINICKKHGIELVFKVGLMKENQICIDMARNLGQEINDMKFQIYSLWPIGRGNEISKDWFKLYSIEDIDLTCKRSSTFFVDEKGNCFPCCLFSKPQNMSVGNIKDISVNQAIKLARQNKLYKYIYYNGFKDILKILIEKKLLNKDLKYANVCHICETIVSSNDLVNAINCLL